MNNTQGVDPIALFLIIIGLILIITDVILNLTLNIKNHIDGGASFLCRLPEGYFVLGHS